MTVERGPTAEAPALLPTVAQATSVLMASWPALDERRIGGWRLGFAEGFTRRANSVWMLGPAEDTQLALGAVEEAYRVRGLPSQFLATETADPRDVAALEAFGYSPTLTGRILCRSLGGEEPAGLEGASGGDLVAVTQAGPELPPDWLDAWLSWSERRLARDRRLAPLILSSGASSFLGVRQEGTLVALARVTVIDGTGVIDCLVTQSAHRGRGHGRLLLHHAQQEAAQRGATSCLAMVVESNAVSRRLFHRAGFTALGSFTYLQAPERVSCC
ncbi:GNAT family N-acetyltransferase [Pseudoclavibacter sp. VKM Ac-2867]|uniref:GNAT family N-acetyltransferase n=1 Tax=Pseudoclavibacter sp. VKM Ac-2867 TaxID=2783829 RepID=UPI00188AAE23|nr:GNAT family N-acetyltransferase [Pseudoclavibacter sp. VKM Ac-2867]MBF4459336.1 GNAT family N-acetyltransferase [Pseudoclavibacter sp. VKM Ac-2867]